MFDDDSGYELTDPKHSSYHDRMASLADQRRKFDREHPTPEELPDPDGTNLLPIPPGPWSSNDGD